MSRVARGRAEGGRNRSPARTGRTAAWAALLGAAALPLAMPAEAAKERSAQGDCVRELERRGYIVVATGNFRQLADGWQMDVRGRDQRGRAVDGTCFVETRTGDVSLFGFGWGGGGQVDRFQFKCASVDNRYRECQLPVDGRVRLVKRKSDAPCTEGRSWGQRGDRIWVDGGCRAEFEVVRSGGGSSGQFVECRSEERRYSECTIGRGYEAQLVRDHTGRCRRDSTWGTRPGVIWVTNGCKGRFQLVATGGSGDAAGQQRAQAQCRNQAEREGIRVRRVAPAEHRGSHWFTTLDGNLAGRAVRADCRYFHKSNRAEVIVRGSRDD